VQHAALASESLICSVASDFVSGIILAAYAIPVSLAYTTLTGLPPQVGVYGYLAGGLGYALAGSPRIMRELSSGVCHSDVLPQGRPGRRMLAVDAVR
jgi:MFS superfamily sulfate permease-like transporter